MQKWKGRIKIPLQIQHPLYTFDTSAFYEDDEYALERKLTKVRAMLSRRKALYKKEPTKVSESLKLRHIHKLNQLAISFKMQLKDAIASHVDITRAVRDGYQVDSNVVCVFDSALTRALNMSETEVNKNIVIIRVYFYQVLESIVKNGFYMNGEKYIMYSASAGQIRTKKVVFIREKDWDDIKLKLMGGLTIDAINKRGGVNINKFLAYKSLCASATDVWKEFDIDKSIIIDDFETNVYGLVDFIDEKDYSIKRQYMDVNIPHTDGCGMVLPSLSKKNFMVRAPWVKGLLASFPFDKFIREQRRAGNTECGIIKDLYGKTHDVLAEDIQVIFTASQFKMHKYYEDWDEYKYFFKHYGCEICKCNEEEDEIDDARFNYQMLQTLTSITDEELEKVAFRTNESIRKVSSDRETMLKVFGATPGKTNKTYLQKSLMIYPELLQDPYCRETLRDLKNSMVQQGKGGRLEIDGKYLFIVPDLYAACEHWFLGVESPVGLLKDGEVYSRIYKDREELDCLRSPHLFREHAVRKNIAHEDSECKRWFKTDGVYTSTHDLISKIAMFDEP